MAHPAAPAPPEPLVVRGHLVTFTPQVHEIQGSVLDVND